MGAGGHVSVELGIKNPISTICFTYISIQALSSAKYLQALKRTGPAFFLSSSFMGATFARSDIPNQIELCFGPMVVDRSLRATTQITVYILYLA